MSYSSDFREIVVKKIHSGMLPLAASKFFEVSRKTIYNWLELYEETGAFNDKIRKEYRPKKIDKQRLIDRINAEPDATLEEIAKDFNCWPQSIHKRCVKLGITRKKNHALRRAKRGKKAEVSGGD